MSDPAGIHSDGYFPFGTQVVTIPSTGSTTYIAESITLDEATMKLVSKNAVGIAYRKVLIDEPFSGSATLQIESAATPRPKRGDVFTIIDDGAQAIAITSTTGGADTTVTTSAAHGLAVGDWVVISDVGTASPSPDGSHRVKTVPTTTTFTIELTTTGSGDAGTLLKAYGCEVEKVGGNRAQDGENKFTIDFSKRLNA